MGNIKDTYEDNKIGWEKYIVLMANKEVLRQMADYLFIDNGQNLRDKIQDNFMNFSFTDEELDKIIKKFDTIK